MVRYPVAAAQHSTLPVVAAWSAARRPGVVGCPVAAPWSAARRRGTVRCPVAAAPPTTGSPQHRPTTRRHGT
ncbi:hypothetical protein, partial [Nocardia uniformis]|uniref:hypothetical protein n=1 Tax=Nocardia uniformis TaxID=53432 RepID=UPI001C3FB6D9